MKFVDNKFSHNDSIELSFRMPFSLKDYKAAELVEELCDYCFGLNFTNTFSSSAQDLTASDLSKELNVDKVECDMHQGDKVVTSAVGELTRTKDKAKLQLIPVDCNS